MIANGRAVFCSQPIRRPETVPKRCEGTPLVLVYAQLDVEHVIPLSNSHYQDMNNLGRSYEYCLN